MDAPLLPEWLELQAKTRRMRTRNEENVMKTILLRGKSRSVDRKFNWHIYNQITPCRNYTAYCLSGLDASPPKKVLHHIEQ